jgi:CTP:molybdopterin cytidylyltransferase MocA
MNIRHALSTAVMQLLQPLVRVLLRHGMAYDEFAELARRAYVQVAERDFTLQGRKQTTSRISVITGLNRKEVARLQAINAQGDPAGDELAHTLNRAAKVVVGWMHEHADASGVPTPLTSEQFAELVRRHSGDMPARAVLDELRHEGSVAAGEDGRYVLTPGVYGAKSTDAGRVMLLGQHAADLLGSIEHNLSHPKEQSYLQQRVFADHIPADRVDLVRQQLREAGLQTLDRVEELLIPQDAGDARPGPGARRVTLGIYYYEQPTPGTDADGTPPPDTTTDRTAKPKRPRSGEEP